MREFVLLLGEILLIALLQTVIETFFDKDKHGVQLRIVNMACILGCLFLLLQFASNNILSEITEFVKGIAID